MIAIGSLVLIMALSLLVIRIATVILMATGIARQSALFQARSAFTGSGFTTSESEAVVNHPVRRRVIAWLMLLGNVGIVSAAGTTIVGFGGASAAGVGRRMIELIVGISLVVLFARSRWADQHITGLVRHVLDRHTDVAERDLGGLLHLSGDYCVQELAVAPGDWIADKTLDSAALRQEGICVLAVVRNDGSFVGAPDGPTVVTVGDTLVVYGRGARLRELDRRSDHSGDRAHREAVREHEAVRDAEISQDPKRGADLRTTDRSTS